MILRKLRVKGWRCFPGEVSIDDFSERITVIHAPNGTGKSTLFEALRRGLADKHRSKAEEMKAVRPWGRELAPSVGIEFAAGGDEYRVEKQWLTKAGARLDRDDGNGFEPVAEDEAAEKRLAELFSMMPPGAGVAKPKHWGLFQVLWATQGQLELTEIGDDLVETIRAELGTQLAAPDTSGIEKRVAEEYARWFTSTGRWRKGADAPPLVAAKEKVRELTARQAELCERLDEIEILQRRVEDARATREQLRADAAGYERQLKEATAAARDFERQAAERQRLVAEAGKAEAEHSRLSERIEGIDSARRDRCERARELEKEEERLPALEAEAGLREKKVRRAKEARNLAEARRRMEEAEKLLARADEATAELGSQRQKRAAIHAPDPKTLKRIRKLDGRRQELRAEVRASAVRLRIELETDGEVSVERGEEAGERTGNVVAIHGVPDAAARIEGVARIEARGPTDDAPERLDEVVRELREITAEFGTRDVEALQTAADEVRDLDAAVAGAKKRVEDLLAERSREEIETELGAASAVVERLSKEGGEEGLDFDAENEALERARADVVGCRIRIEGAEKALLDIDARIGQLTADGMTDEERVAARRKAALSHEAATAKLEECGGDGEEDPREQLEHLEEIVNDHRRRSEEAGVSEGRELVRLQSLTERGDWVEMAAIEENLATLRREVESEEGRANAVKLLHETIERYRAASLSAVAGPVGEVATRHFHRIAGSRLGPVGFTTGMIPDHVRPARAEEDVPDSALSGGEREQLHLAVRLALAEVLAKSERQLVVLDDVLNATDGGRLARALRVLDEAADRLQIVILTCHPERYGTLREATTVDLVERLGATPSP